MWKYQLPEIEEAWMGYKLNSKIKVISFEGLPGTGKKILAEHLSINLGGSLNWIDYPQNSFLSDYYLVDELNGLAMEVSLLLQRRDILKKVLQPGIFSPGPFITDANLHRGRIYASCTLNAEEYHLFLEISSLVLDQLPQPDLLVYLREDPQVVKSKIAKSEYKPERDIDREYLENLSQAMDDYLLNLPLDNMLIVNGYDSSSEVITSGVIQEIVNFNEGIRYYNIGKG